MKGEYFARFNPDLWDKYTELVGKGNIKNDLEEYIRTRLASKSLDNVNIEILRQEIETLKESKVKIDSELKTKLDLETQYKAKVQELEKLKLEQTKEEILNASKCVQCDLILSKQERVHEFNKGLICNSCFHNATPEQTKSWMENKKDVVK